jgi:hypothetical protein
LNQFSDAIVSDAFWKGRLKLKKARRRRGLKEIQQELTPRSRGFILLGFVESSPNGVCRSLEFVGIPILVYETEVNPRGNLVVKACLWSAPIMSHREEATSSPKALRQTPQTDF